MTRPPIEDGALLVVAGRIAEVGSWKSLCSTGRDETLDLGEVILLPGLINSHCHLDYTDLVGKIQAPRSFTDWIKALLALKAHWSYSDYAASWLRGAHMLLRSGTTSVADIESVPELLPEVRSATPLRVCSLLELTGVRSRRPAAAILRDAVRHMECLPPDKRWSGLSPHALYSTSPELRSLCAEAARVHDWVLAIHIAESAEEFEMYMSGRGAMFAWLRQQRDMSECGTGSPVSCAQRSGLFRKKSLAVHVNYLAPGDARILAGSGATVVHCPRSHAYFGHDPFPFQELDGAGVNICLGTDSLATVRCRGRERPGLSLFAEMNTMAEAFPGLRSERILKMATVHAAASLGEHGRLGELSPGCHADLIVVEALRECSVKDCVDRLVQTPAKVLGSMIRGVWVVPPGAK